MEIQIIYEDEDILILNKPAGVLFDWILAERSGLIPAHRLDKETSGVILFAKSEKAYEFLKKQFQEREVKKTYVAIVWGDVKKEEGLIDASIGRSAKFGKFIASRGKRGKIREAVTEYKVLKRFTTPPLDKLGAPLLNQGGDGGGNYFTLLEVYPKTGRTHQIRVHMKYINHPIVCDSLYAAKKECPIAGLSRLALHAKSIEFTLPSGKKMKAETPLPEDLSRVIV